METELKLFKFYESCTFTLTHEVVAHSEQEALSQINEPSDFYDRWKDMSIGENCDYDNTFRLKSIGVPTKSDLKEYEENQRNK